ncbi:GTP-binding protein [Methylomonas sp. LL1]|uniref:putative glycoside hydrolase n=1 Tax=Methylomonas sp. LL1 TaxID=2785785 RepID=UPI0018C3BB50|nr:putative glycoside hydrolase [Methylomonas sp. LL1]QPK65295.1 GTP-binding protein [Methylomonas sp. LL1]
MKNQGRCLALLIGFLFWATATLAHEGRVTDAATGLPIEAALVSMGDQAVRTDKDGMFRLEGSGETLKLKAAGYARREIAGTELGSPGADIGLTPFTVKGLYLTVYGIASTKLREAALKTIETNHLNALVIDVKGDRGFIPFQVDLPLAEQIGAQDTILVKDMKSLLTSLKEKKLYLIARIVVFKDDRLAKARPDLAVRTKSGGIYTDREHLRWVDPFSREVWDYNIGIAKTVAELGFDEVQFDYVRFPDTRGGAFSKPATEDNRTEAITGFLQAAHQALIPYNVLVAADIFGYVVWNSNDTDIGQKIVPISQAVDVISPMLYPSGYHLGIPKYRNPVKNPYQIVYQSLKQAQERTGVSPLRFRPWLQAFRDYAFRGGDFKEERMRIQIKAAEDFGASGWMFWNPRNVYPEAVFSDIGREQ